MKDVSGFTKKVKCLDNPDKLRILDLLFREGEKSITDVRKQLRMSFSTTHKFLSEMEKSGLLSSRTETKGKLKKLYKIEDFSLSLTPQSISDMLRADVPKEEEKPFSIRVIGSNGEVENFSVEDLKKICTDTGVPLWITNRVVASMRGKLQNGLSISEIRDYVLGRLKDEMAILGKTVDQITDSELFGSNMLFTFLEGKNLNDALRAHVDADIHIRNLARAKPISVQHRIRPIFRSGLVFGAKKLTNPANRFSTALDNLRVLMEEASNDIIVVHGFDHLNVFLAPYVKKMPYTLVKQAVREFLFKAKILNRTQNVQSYINLDSVIPKCVADMEAIGPSGEVVGKYSDYSEESQKIMNAFFDAISEAEEPFDYPRIVVKLWNKKFDTKKLNAAVKNLPVFYVANMLPTWQTENASFMDEITRLDASWRECKGTRGTGNLQSVTINLPRIALRAKGNDDRLFEILKDKSQLAIKTLLTTGEIIAGRTFVSGTKYLTELVEGEKSFNMDTALHSLSFGGLNEMLKIHVGDELHESKAAQDFAMKVINVMNNSFKGVETVRFGLNECEATWTKRFAISDMSKFGAENVVFKGTAKAPYYTTGSNLSEGAKISDAERLAIESKFQPKIKAGHMSVVKYNKNLNLSNLFKSKIGFAKVAK